jgi:hydrocephalus-inducing protein
VHQDIRQEGIALTVTGAAASAAAATSSALKLQLACTGVCVAQPSDSVHALQFTAPVRQQHSQSVTLSNPSDKPWYIEPVVKGVHYEGAAQLCVPARSSANYSVTFRPSTMTSSATFDRSDAPSVHAGTLFFPLPDGTGIMYALSGTATEPTAEAPVLQLNTPAKVPLSFTLPVKNWLCRAQRFEAVVTLLDAATQPSTQLRGAATVEVPALGVKDYALRFTAYCEGVTRARVTLTNAATGEYQYYDVVVAATAAAVQEVIALETTVRAAVKHIITIDNPLPPSTAVTFASGSSWWQCDNRCVRLRQLGSMTGNQEGNFELEYRPLLPSPGAVAEHCALSFTVDQLGTYRYTLQLVAIPAAAAPALRFETPLGAAASSGASSELLQLQVYLSNSDTNKVVEFDCAVERHPQYFRISPKVTVSSGAWEGQSVSLPVLFEPEAAGTVEDILTVSHAVYGTYKCALKGVCTAPVPQGPYKIANGAVREIQFKNVFAAAQEYSFTLDNPAFTVVGGAKATIPAKTVRPIQIKYTQQPTVAGTVSPGSSSSGAGDGTVTAKLIVQCVSSSGSSGNSSAAAAGANKAQPWVFYLQGGKA